MITLKSKILICTTIKALTKKNYQDDYISIRKMYLVRILVYYSSVNDSFYTYIIHIFLEHVTKYLHFAARQNLEYKTLRHHTQKAEKYFVFFVGNSEIFHYA